MTGFIRKIRVANNMRAVKGLLEELRSAGQGPAQSLADALDDFFSLAVSPEQEYYVHKIESLRKELEVSQEEITIVDYGVTGPELTAPSGAANQGTTVTQILGQTCRASSIPPMWGLLLFQLIRAFKPSHILELGTFLGMSAAYQAAALEMNGTGRMLSLEGAGSLAKLARRNLAQLELERAAVKTGPFKATLEGALQELEEIDYAFIDGHHDEKATLRYFEQILPFASDSAVFVFDDIYWSEGMRRAWDTISACPRVKIAVDLSKLGICVLSKAIKSKKSYQVTPGFWQKALFRAECALGAA